MRKLYGTIRELKEWPWRGRPGREEGTREILFPPTPYVAKFREFSGRLRRPPLRMACARAS